MRCFDVIEEESDAIWIVFDFDFIFVGSSGRVAALEGLMDILIYEIQLTLP